MNSWIRIATTATLLACLAWATPSAVGDYTFVTLDDPSTPAGIYAATYAAGINDSGQVIGRYLDAIHDSNIFVYSGGSKGTYTTLSMPPLAINSYAGGINYSGQVVGYYYTNTNNSQSFLYSAGTYFLRPTQGLAYGINNSDQIVGSSGKYGFVDSTLSGGTFTALTGPSMTSYNISARGINDSGLIVGSYQDSSSNSFLSFLYSGGTYSAINDPLGVSGTIAYGINNSGVVVGSYTDSSNQSHGFIESGGVYTTIDVLLAGAYGTYATGINSSGQVVGYYSDSSGQSHGFVATPTVVPEPSSLLMCGLGGIAITGWAAWRQRRRVATA